MIDQLLLPFAFPFMQQAFAIALLVAAPMALLSTFLVLKGWSLMGDAISHAVLPGIVIAYIIGIPLPVGAFAAGKHGAHFIHAHAHTGVFAPAAKELTPFGIRIGQRLAVVAASDARTDLGHLH